jgi:hypothetical protein
MTTQAPTIPNDIQAPYMVQTPSLYYYVGNVTISTQKESVWDTKY